MTQVMNTFGRLPVTLTGRDGIRLRVADAACSMAVIASDRADPTLVRRRRPSVPPAAAVCRQDSPSDPIRAFERPTEPVALAG